MDKLFVAKCRIQQNDGYESSNVFYNKIHIVKAEDERQAEEKVQKYYKDKCSPYSTYYSVLELEISEPIE